MDTQKHQRDDDKGGVWYYCGRCFERISIGNQKHFRCDKCNFKVLFKCSSKNRENHWYNTSLNRYEHEG